MYNLVHYIHLAVGTSTTVRSADYAACAMEQVRTLPAHCVAADGLVTGEASWLALPQAVSGFLVEETVPVLMTVVKLLGWLPAV